MAPQSDTRCIPDPVNIDACAVTSGTSVIFSRVVAMDVRESSTILA